MHTHTHFFLLSPASFGLFEFLWARTKAENPWKFATCANAFTYKVIGCLQKSYEFAFVIILLEELKKNEEKIQQQQWNRLDVMNLRQWICEYGWVFGHRCWRMRFIEQYMSTKCYQTEPRERERESGRRKKIRKRHILWDFFFHFNLKIFVWGRRMKELL